MTLKLQATVPLCDSTAKIDDNSESGFVLLRFSSSGIDFTFNSTIYQDVYFAITTIHVTIKGNSLSSRGDIKFMTPRSSVYKCRSVIPVYFENNAKSWIEMANVTLRAFSTTAVPGKNECEFS